MANYRLGRINEEMQKELSGILREVKDPRVGRSFISITAVDCTADLKYAKVYYSTVGLRGDDLKELEKGLKSAGGFIRSQLAHRMDLRQTPELTFIRDTSMENGAHISELLRKVEAELPPEDNNG